MQCHFCKYASNSAEYAVRIGCSAPFKGDEEKVAMQLCAETDSCHCFIPDMAKSTSQLLL